MLAITIYQPHATLVVLGLKKYETRNWATKRRGWVAIHAGVKPVNQHLISREPFVSALGEADLPLGAIVGVVRIREVWPNEHLKDAISWRQEAFGDYTLKYGWQLTDAIRLIEPVPVRGVPGWWPVKAEHIERMIPQLRGQLGVDPDLVTVLMKGL